MLTPLRRRPWKVASQVATVDQLSGGRVILTVGWGAVEADLLRTGEELELGERADLMDDGISLMRSSWTGDGRHRGTRYAGEWPQAGCTWWLESRWEPPHHSRERRGGGAGPPGGRTPAFHALGLDACSLHPWSPGMRRPFLTPVRWTR